MQINIKPICDWPIYLTESADKRLACITQTSIQSTISLMNPFLATVGQNRMKKCPEVTQTLRTGCSKADPQTNTQTNGGDYNTLCSLACSKLLPTPTLQGHLPFSSTLFFILKLNITFVFPLFIFKRFASNPDFHFTILSPRFFSLSGINIKPVAEYYSSSHQ